MLLSKKQRKIFVFIIAVATVALILTSFLPFLAAF